MPKSGLFLYMQNYSCSELKRDDLVKRYVIKNTSDLNIWEDEKEKKRKDKLEERRKKRPKLTCI